MTLLSSLKLELDVGAGRVDITPYLDLAGGASTKFGRSSQFTPPAPGTLSLRLDNTDGRFTPGRQVLADGVTAHPFWPNLLPGAKIYLSWVVGANTYPRFSGYVKGWPSTLLDGQYPRVQLEATTVDDRLSRVTMLSPFLQETLAAAPTLYWPLTDPDGLIGFEANGGPPMTLHGGSLGNPGPGDGNTAAAFGATGYMTTSTRKQLGAVGALVFWIKTTHNPVATSWLMFSNDLAIAVGISTAGVPVLRSFLSGTQVSASGAPNVLDGGWHQIRVDLVSATSYKLQVDTGTPALLAAAGATGTVKDLSFGAIDSFLSLGGDPYAGSIAQVAFYSGGLSPTALGQQFDAGFEFVGETVDERIARFLRYAGLSSLDYTLDASDVVLSSYPQAGKDIVGGCQDQAVSEGGGSIVYVGTDGDFRFKNRDARKPAAPTLIVDAAGDLDGQNFAPAFDSTQVVNQVTGTRATATTTPSSFTVSDAASQAQYGLTTDEFTSYAQDDDDVLANAQDRLVAQREPAYRLGQVGVELTTATSLTIYGDVAATDVSDRLRVTNLPVTVAPATQVEVIVEGWADTYDADKVTVVFDTSPADNPPMAVYDDATYGRYQCDGQTLAAALTAAATTVQIASPAGTPTFTTNAAMYPLKIRVGAEHIQLNGAPGGASSPQTFTGVTRGVDGTTAAAQASGSAVDLYPAVTYAL